MSILADKKVICIGDRDGVPAPTLEECVKAAGGQVVFSSTECFVWTAAGAMDLENQKRVKDIAEEYGLENVVVLLGAAEAEAAGLAAETVTAGDPTYAGPLSGVSLGLSVYHVCEEEIKAVIPQDLYEEQVGMMEMVLNVEEIASEMQNMRSQYAKY